MFKYLTLLQTIYPILKGDQKIFNGYNNSMKTNITILLLLLTTGCGIYSIKSPRLPISYEKLSYFQIDCSKAKEQTEFLIALKRTPGEMQADRIKAYVMPWKILNDPDVHARWNHSGYGGYNRMIDSHLHDLSTQCGNGPGYMW